MTLKLRNVRVDQTVELEHWLRGKQGVKTTLENDVFFGVWIGFAR